MKEVIRHESSDAFFGRLSETARRLDRGEPVEACVSVSFEDAGEMQAYLDTAGNPAALQTHKEIMHKLPKESVNNEIAGVGNVEHIELEPCPFCYPHAAGDEYPPTIKKEVDGSRYWCVWAPCCDFFGPLFLTPQEAATAWNRRGLVSQVTGKEVVETLEKILAEDPQAILENSAVYSVTQEELLEFVAQMAPKQARDAIATLTRRLKAEREGVEEYKSISSLAVTALEQELAELKKSSEVWKARAALAKGFKDKNKFHREHLEDVFMSLAGLLHDVQSLDDGDMPPHNREILAAMDTEMKDLKHKTHVAIEYPTPLDEK